MKCLRCGREIGNSNECLCGHFYENNLDKNKNYKPKYDKYGNKINRQSKKDKKDKKDKIGVLDVICISLGLSPAIILLVLLIKSIIINVPQPILNPVKGVPTDDYCSFLCEGKDYIIDGDYCKCTDGREYSFH